MDRLLYISTVGLVPAIRRYTANGDFIHNIPVQSAGGIYCIRIENERLFVDVARRRAIDELDLEGRPLRTDILRGEDTSLGGCVLDAQVASLEESITELRINFVDGRAPVLMAWRM